MTTHTEHPSSAPITAPRLTQALIDAWSQVLAGIPVAPDDDFFALGGHSLLAGRVALRLRADLGVEIPFAWFFEHPTARSLAEAVAASAER